MAIHVLGISGSPRIGATHRLVQAALLGACEVPGTTTEFVSLDGKEIHGCTGCGQCARLGRCVIEDDMQPLYDRLVAADAIILGTPVYYGSASALAKAFMERVQALGSSEKKLRLKVGGAIASGQGRNGGQETTIQGIQLWMHINDMLPVGITSPSGQWGVTAQAGFDPDDIASDEIVLKKFNRRMKTIESAWLYGRKIATIARIVQDGKAASGLDLPDRPYGQNLPDTFPEALYQIR